MVQKLAKMNSNFSLFAKVKQKIVMKVKQTEPRRNAALELLNYLLTVEKKQTGLTLLEIPISRFNENLLKTGQLR